MSYKTKSLLYFVCFVLSAFSYYVLDNTTNNAKKYSEVEIVDISNENLEPIIEIESKDLN